MVNCLKKKYLNLITWISLPTVICLSFLPAFNWARLNGYKILAYSTVMFPLISPAGKLIVPHWQVPLIDVVGLFSYVFLPRDLITQICLLHSFSYVWSYYEDDSDLQLCGWSMLRNIVCCYYRETIFFLDIYLKQIIKILIIIII